MPMPTAPKVVNQPCTHLPDCVVFADHRRELPSQSSFQGVLMFLDISGFTALCESFSNSKNGTDQLTKTLNGYMAALVGEILYNDGDVLKFAGDAILTLWKVDSFLTMKVTVEHVIRSALKIQEKYGEWTTSVGIKLRVKIGISAGEVNMAFIGNNEFCHYVTLGRAVESVNKAENLCNSGDVVISPSAWCHCSGLPLECDVLEDNKHMKALEFHELTSQTKYDFRRTIERSSSIDYLFQEAEDPEKTAIRASMLKTGRLSIVDRDLSSELKKKATFGTVKPATDVASKAIDKSARLRLAVLENDSFLNTRLRLYVSVQVITKLDEHQPLEYLSEMRQVTIVFINLQLEEVTKYELTRTLQESFKSIYTHVKAKMGNLNKIFMFDKGCTYLAVFGLPGFKHENDCAHALFCAAQMKKELDHVDKVSICSIGVTTGSTFCGVVGHKHRHEYTVIGRKVNMAARLMMYYPGLVTCDNETFHHSKLHRTNFTVLELKQMKGLSNIGTIRAYNENKGGQDAINALMQQERQHPLIGRKNELQVFQNELDKFSSTKQSSSQNGSMVVIKGEGGVGKTRMLDAIIVAASKMDCKVVFGGLGLQDLKTSYSLIKLMLQELLEFGIDTSRQDREQALFEMFQDQFIVDNMSIFNEWLHLELPVPKRLREISTEDEHKLLIEVIVRMINEVVVIYKHIVFAVDDGQNMDVESWEFVPKLWANAGLMLVIVYKSASGYGESKAHQALKNASVMIELPPLQAVHMCPLACQLLGVVQIPERLETLLQEKSQGVASWCEQLLQSMCQDGTISLEPLQGAAFTEQMVQPGDIFLPRRASHIALFQMGAGYTGGLNDTKQREMVAIIPAGASLDIQIPTSIRGMIQARIDRMHPTDQVVVKTAAVLGKSFPLEMLYATVPQNVGHHKINNSLVRLIRNRIIECEALLERNASPAGMASLTSKKDPENSVINDHIDCDKFKMVKFATSDFQEIAYDMFLENVRVPLHIKAAQFLERIVHKCDMCGGRNFLDRMPQEQDRHVQVMSAVTVITDDASKTMAVQAVTVEGGGAEVTPLADDSDDKDNRSVDSMKRLNPNKTKGKSARKVQPENQSNSNMLTSTDATSEQNVPEPSNISERDDSILNTADEKSTMTRRTNVPRVPSRPRYCGSLPCSILLPRGVRMSPECLLDQGTVVLPVGLLTPATRRTNVPRVPSRPSQKWVDYYIDIRECTCHVVLTDLYPMLIRHWMLTGDTGRTLNVILDAGAAALYVGENAQALEYMEEAQTAIRRLKQSLNPFEKDSSRMDPYVVNKWEEAKVFSLLGQALINASRVKEAMQAFNSSLQILGSPQPHRCREIYLVTIREGFQQWQHRRWPQSKFGMARDVDILYMIVKTECLAYLFHYHYSRHAKRKALLTVLQQLNIAEVVFLDFHELIRAYTCMMECCLMMSWKEKGKEYENKAKKRCDELNEDVILDEINTIIDFNMTALTVRLSWGNLSLAIEYGYIARDLVHRIHSNDKKLLVLPMLATALIQSSRIIDAVEILQDLEYTVNETNSVIGQAAYFGLCLDLILQTAFQVEDAQSCIECGRKLKYEAMFLDYPTNFYYLCCGIALWYERKNDNLLAKKWFRRAIMVTPTAETLVTTRGFAMLIECRLIRMSSIIRQQNWTAVATHNKALDQEMKRFQLMVKHQPVMVPRMHHLTAYVLMLRHKSGSAKKKIAKCIKESIATFNALELDSCRHTQAVWFTKSPDKIMMNSWMSQAMTNTMHDWHAASDMNPQDEQEDSNPVPLNSLVLYLLPRPIKVKGDVAECGRLKQRSKWNESARVQTMTVGWAV
ncbi:Adenylate cyclase type 10 [Lamellibrachia satsuma]|nr:Adenylate cyclase type 10 [Lamellibrachia satsuma]